MEKSIIIVGAGIAGLSAGCYARMNRYKTTIFEMDNTRAGGLCTSWNRKGYMINGCIRFLLGSRPENGFYNIWKELGVTQDQQMIEPDEFIRVEDEQGKAFVLYTDVNHLEQHMKEIAPEDTKVIEEFTNGIRSCLTYEMPVEKTPNSNQKCLEQMANALRPGGILLIIDADWSFARITNLNHPDAVLVDRLFKASSRAGAKSGLLDPYCGGNLREKLEGIGFTDVNAEGTFPINRGSSPAAMLLKRNAQIFKPGIIASGEISEPEFNRLESLLDDPSFYYVNAAAIAAWGRK